MKNINYNQPKNLKEAATLFKNRAGATPYAGGTDLLGMMKDNIIPSPGTMLELVDLKQIPGLNTITYTKGKGLSIGALVTIAEVAAHPEITTIYPALAQAAQAVASPQLRNVGTIAGNLCQRPRCWYFRGEFDCIRKGGDTCFAVEGENKFHCVICGGPCFIVHPSDTAVALTAYQASVETVLGKKKRTHHLDNFFVLPDKNEKVENVLQPGEIITRIHVPEPKPGAGRFIKYSEREVWDFATISGALVYEGSKEKFASGRLVLGGVAPVPWLEKEVSKHLSGFVPEKTANEKLAASALKGAEPMTQNSYKLPMVRNLILELLS